MFFKVRANRRVGKSKDPKNRVPEIAVPDLVCRLALSVKFGTLYSAKLLSDNPRSVKSASASAVT